MDTAGTLRQKVQAELEWEPSLDAEGIGVAVHEGAITLTGHVQNYMQKLAAEKAAKRVADVIAVANDLVVRPTGSMMRDDTDIAREVADVLGWNVGVPEGVKAVVMNGWVTLSGTVEWGFQKRAAEKAIRGLRSVRGISNDIVLKQRPTPTDVKHRIDQAFERSAQVDADHIDVSVRDGRVTLTGTVRSWSERMEAEYAAWAAPGVTSVKNHLKVAALASAAF
jgi:osmotically-inducible protein OsmY